MRSLSIPFRFKNRDAGYALINTLVTMERSQPKAFWSAVVAISDEFEMLNGKIGEATVLGKPHSHESTPTPPQTNLDEAIHHKTAPQGTISPKATDIDQFLAMRFRDRELGHQIVITLIEIESRDGETFKKLSRTITHSSKGTQSS